MELRPLRTLVAIADNRSFAAAGEAVGLTQSAVSLQVKALEEELGVPLFDRSRRPPVLNADGRALVDRAREVLAAADSLTAAFRAPTPVAGSLALGAVPTALSGLLPPVLRALRQTAPEIRLTVHSGLSHELEQRVLNRDLDVAVMTQPLQLTPGVAWHPVLAERLMVIAPAELPGDGADAWLAAAPFIRFKRFAFAGQVIEAEMRRLGVRPETAMEIDSLESIVGLVAHGLGVSIVPERYGADSFPPTVKAQPFGDPPVTRLLGLLEPAENPRAGLVRRLQREIQAVLAAHKIKILEEVD